MDLTNDERVLEPLFSELHKRTSGRARVHPNI